MTSQVSVDCFLGAVNIAPNAMLHASLKQLFLFCLSQSAFERKGSLCLHMYSYHSSWVTVQATDKEASKSYDKAPKPFLAPACVVLTLLMIDHKHYNTVSYHTCSCEGRTFFPKFVASCRVPHLRR